jgi:hypothetical protein
MTVEVGVIDTAIDGAIGVTINFVPGSQAIPDPDHPGLLRSSPSAAAPYAREAVESHQCVATDLCQDGVAPPELLEHGFDTVDLSGFGSLQEVFAGVRAAGRITDDDAAAIRTALQGATLDCVGGRTITVLHIADEGLIMRTAGPDGMSVVAPRSSGMNDHGGATSIHADQDVFGTPLTQVMDGRAPSLFRHDSPDGRNHEAGLMLVNVWIPLQQVTQPLVLADGRSIDRRRHQLRHALATDSFLEREEDVSVNDIWTFLHDPGQRWFLRSDMGHRNAYVFDTLSTPHGACTLPGEDVAASCYRALEAAEDAAAAGDVAALVDAAGPARDPGVPAGVPSALRQAIGAMSAVADDALADPDHVCGDGATAWSARSVEARRGVVRMSLEMRMVVSIDA